MFRISAFVKSRHNFLVRGMSFKSMSDNEIRSTFMASPVFEQAQFQSTMLDSETSLSECKLLASVLLESLNLQSDNINSSQKVRIFGYYLPVFYWLRRTLQYHRQQRGTNHNLVFGLSCPQGGGKTTLGDAIKLLCGKSGIRCEVVSVDDFYLPRSQQQKLASQYPDNPLLQYRGNPGTHDLALGVTTVRALSGRGGGVASSTPAPTPTPPGTHTGGVVADVEGGGGDVRVRVPRFDKAAAEGRGDRRPVADWPVVPVPVDVVLVEGWCVGFRALPPGTPLIDPHLEPVNAALAGADLMNNSSSTAAAAETATATATGAAAVVVETATSSEAGTATATATSEEEAGTGTGTGTGEGTVVTDVDGTAATAAAQAVGGGFPELYGEVDAWLLLKARRVEAVYSWREEAERGLRARGGGGMTPDQVKDFVDRFMPAYRQYLPGLWGWARREQEQQQQQQQKEEEQGQETQQEHPSKRRRVEGDSGGNGNNDHHHQSPRPPPVLCIQLDENRSPQRVEWCDKD